MASCSRAPPGEGWHGGGKAKNTNIEATLAGNTNIGATLTGNTNTGEGDTNIGAILGPRDNRDDGARALEGSPLLYTEVQYSDSGHGGARGLVWTVAMVELEASCGQSSS